MCFSFPHYLSSLITFAHVYRYKSREEFANDARLVFRNCDIFNEDDSEVISFGLFLLNSQHMITASHFIRGESLLSAVQCLFS